MVFPIVWSGAISLLCTTLFWVIRSAFESRASSGTELFALLFAVDVSVAMGVVDVARLAGERLGSNPDIYRTAAILLLVGTLVVSIPIVVVDKDASSIWRGIEMARAAGAPNSQTVVQFKRYVRLLWASYMIRWIVGSFHLFWIIKTPRWALLQ